MRRERHEHDTPTVETDRSTASLAPRINFGALENIRALQRDGRPDILERIIRAFCSDTPELIETLREATGKEDVETVRQVAHRLKSSCATVGAESLAESFREIEELGRSGVVGIGVADLERIRLQFIEVQSLLRKKFLGGVSC